MTKEELAKWLHDNYEAVAKEQNWNTQQSCKVDFDTLPDANKRTMIEMADRLLNFNLLRLHFVLRQSKQLVCPNCDGEGLAGKGTKDKNLHVIPALNKALFVGGAVTVNKLIEVLERDYGWSFHDENGTLHITDMQREYMIDIAKATKDILLG